MPDNAASSYANSIDPAGGIQQPHAKPELSGHNKPIEVKADFNAGLPITADQQVSTQGSEQVGNTKLAQDKGPKMTGPFGEAIYAGAHKGDMIKDGAKAIDHMAALNQGGFKQEVKGKAVVPQETLQKLKLINARGSLKKEFTERMHEARTQERDQSLQRSNGRSL